MKKTSMTIRDFKGPICPVQRFSAMNVSNSDCSIKNKKYIFDNLGLVPNISLMA